MKRNGAKIAALVAFLLSGCGTVRPEGDYKRAGVLVQQHTGVQEVYDPAIDTTVQAKVAMLLEDGLTVDEAVQLALLNNRALQSQFHNIGISSAELTQSALLSNPSISISTRLLDVGGRANLSFGLAQELVDLWQIPVRKRIAKDRLESTIFTVAKSAIDLSAKVRAAFVKVCVEQDAGAVIKENLDLLQHTLELTQRRFDAGETTILDVNLVRSAVLDGTLRLATLQRDQETLRATLDHLLGLSVENREVDLHGIPIIPEAPPKDDKSLLEQALRERFDIRVASRDLDAAAEEISHQKRAVVPSVALGLDGERPDLASTKTQTSLASRIAAINTAAISPSQALQDKLVERIDEARQRKLDRSQTVDLLLGPSLQFTLPIFDQNRAQIAKARFLFEQKQKDYEELLLTVVEEVRQAAAALRASADMLEIVTQQAMPLAEQNVGTAERIYEAGEDSILALLLAQQTLNGQKEAKIRLAGDYAIAAAELQRVLGGIAAIDTPVAAQ